MWKCNYSNCSNLSISLRIPSVQLQATNPQILTNADALHTLGVQVNCRRIVWKQSFLFHAEEVVVMPNATTKPERKTGLKTTQYKKHQRIPTWQRTFYCSHTTDATEGDYINAEGTAYVVWYTGSFIIYTKHHLQAEIEHTTYFLL